MSIISGKKILLVEDDKFLSEMVAKRFVAEGAVISYADNGSVVVEMVKRSKFDLVILDLLLPGTSGFDILKSIKEDEKIKDTPVVILSNLGQKNDVDMGMKLGASKFLIKAILSLDEILDQISEVLSSK